jgi:hypothetical protein
MNKKQIKSRGFYDLTFSSFLGLLLLLILVFFGLNLLDDEPSEVTSQETIQPTAESENKPEETKNMITATGSYSYDKYSVDVSLTFPLEGGAVSGSFSGDCDGNITGNYAGGDGGAINGQGSGRCFIPAISGSFSGTVNQSKKSVPINAKGSVIGVTKSINMTLSY